MIKSKKKKLEDRVKENMEFIKDLILGRTQRQWLAEEIEDVADDPEWFNDVVEAYDTLLADSKTYTVGNKLEHTAAYALQRDAHYAYASRKTLMAKGFDSQLEGAYHDGFAALLLTEEGTVA